MQCSGGAIRMQATAAVSSGGSMRSIRSRITVSATERRCVSPALGRFCRPQRGGEVMMLAQKVTAVTHKFTREGMKGACRRWRWRSGWARSGADKTKTWARITRDYDPLDLHWMKSAGAYAFDVSCQMSCRRCAFFESSDFEDAIRLAISIGGDSDTIGAMTGGIAAYYGIPAAL